MQLFEAGGLSFSPKITLLQTQREREMRAFTRSKTARARKSSLAAAAACAAAGEKHIRYNANGGAGKNVLYTTFCKGSALTYEPGGTNIMMRDFTRLLSVLKRFFFFLQRGQSLFGNRVAYILLTGSYFFCLFVPSSSSRRKSFSGGGEFVMQREWRDVFDIEMAISPCPNLEEYLWEEEAAGEEDLRQPEMGLLTAG